MQTIVFKLSYKSANAPSAKILNVKHLHYIATRAGVVRNNGCGFGLFGKLPNMAEQRDINNLWNAQKIAREASNGHTLWRAVLSFDHETALEKGFYKRATWEALVKEKIGVVAKGMGIEPGDICYMASMHYKKGHPHTHLVFWDKSSRIHTEFIQKDKFEHMTDTIRAEFNKTVFKDEILQKLTDKKEAISSSRVEVLALMRELNTEEILDVNRINQAFRNEVSAEFENVIKAVSLDKNRRYAYLTPDTKTAIDNFTDKLFERPQFSTLKKKYIKSTVEASKLYGNSGIPKAEILDAAMKQFHKEIGNEMLKFIKESDLIKTYVLAHPPREAALIGLITTHINASVHGSSLYANLKNAFPSERTPLSEIMDDEFKSNLNRLIVTVLRNEAINGQLYLQKSFDNYCSDDENFESDKKPAIYGVAYKVARQCILNSLYEESGYTQSYKIDTMESMLITLFGELGRSKNHEQNRMEYARHHSDLSETALKDLRAKRKQSQNEHEIY